MNEFVQGDVIKLAGFQNSFLIISKNSFIRSTGTFHVCPLLSGRTPGPVHIPVKMIKSETEVTAMCEQVKLIDPKARGIGLIDRISYADKMEVSDTVQGIFEYD